METDLASELKANYEKLRQLRRDLGRAKETLATLTFPGWLHRVLAAIGLPTKRAVAYVAAAQEESRLKEEADKQERRLIAVKLRVWEQFKELQRDPRYKLYLTLVEDSGAIRGALTEACGLLLCPPAFTSGRRREEWAGKIDSELRYYCDRRPHLFYRLERLAQDLLPFSSDNYHCIKTQPKRWQLGEDQSNEAARLLRLQLDFECARATRVYYALRDLEIGIIYAILTAWAQSK